MFVQESAVTFVTGAVAGTLVDPNKPFAAQVKNSLSTIPTKVRYKDMYYA